MKTSCEQCKTLSHQIHIHEVNNQDLLDENMHLKEEAESYQIKIKVLEEQVEKYKKELFQKL